MIAARQLKQKIAAGEPVVGALTINHLWPEFVEIAQMAGLDYFIICHEHGAIDLSTTADICAAARIAQIAVLIRPAANDFRTVAKTLDLGPSGLLLPCIETTGDMDVIRDAVWMPPRGRRRPGGRGNYWVDDYHYETWKSEVEDDLIIIPQIETPLGLENVDAIAAHEVVTAIGIGPYDLSISMNLNVQMDHPDYLAAIDRIRKAGEKAGKTMWRIGLDTRQLRDEGHHFICTVDPMSLLRIALQQRVEQAKG